VAQHADEALPGLQLLLAQRLADVGQHEQCVRPTVLTERAASHFPTAAAAGECHVHRAWRRAFEHVDEAHLLRGPSEQPLRRLREQ
jgi:hypothetical protein